MQNEDEYGNNVLDSTGRPVHEPGADVDVDDPYLCFAYLSS